MPRTVVFLVVLLVAPGAAAQPRPFEPAEGYYKAEGVGITAAWTLDRTELAEGESLTATLTVKKATNPHQIVRPDLRKLPAFNDAFQIEDAPGPAAKPKDASVSFAYRLKPRGRNVTRVPSLDFFFYNPSLTRENKFMKTVAKGADIIVKAVPKKARPVVPLDAPDSLLEVVTGPHLLDRAPFSPGTGLWAGVLLGAPLAAFVWLLVWRRVYPDAARLARRRRSLAARRAVAAIRKAGRTADPAGAVGGAVLGYLRARFPMPEAAATPGEIGDALLAVERAEEEVDEVVAFFRRCDAARFGLPSDSALSLAADAEALVARLEAAA